MGNTLLNELIDVSKKQFEFVLFYYTKSIVNNVVLAYCMYIILNVVCICTVFAFMLSSNFGS